MSAVIAGGRGVGVGDTGDGGRLVSVGASMEAVMVGAGGDTLVSPPTSEHATTAIAAGKAKASLCMRLVSHGS